MTFVSITTKLAIGALFVNVPHIKRAGFFSMLVFTSFMLTAIASYNDKDHKYWNVVIVATMF